ncbi:glycosyltransferase [Priestia megaterium]
MSNILFLTHIYPYPPDDGGRIVTFNTLRILQERKHKVFLFSFMDKLNEKKYDMENLEQHLVNKDYSNDTINLIKNLFEKLPFTMKKYVDSSVEKIIEKVLKTEQIDFVILDHLHMANYVNLIRKLKPEIPVYLRQHNIESIIMKRAYEKEENILKKLYLLFQYKKLHKYESNICELMDRIFVITEEDKEMLINMNPAIQDIEVVKAGVDFTKYKPISYEKRNKEYNLVFLGAMNWLPNENGVMWFTDNVLPKLLDKFSNIKFYIVGKNPSEKIMELHKRYPDNIKVTGYVEDEREYIAMADVFIVPLLIGGGMRLKILNALAMKKAIVTTTIGAEGINLNDSYMVADSSSEFSNAIEKLFLDIEYREYIEKNGYEQVVKYYSFDAVSKPLLDAL